MRSILFLTAVAPALVPHAAAQATPMAISAFAVGLGTVADFNGNGFRELVIGDAITGTLQVYDGTPGAGGTPTLLTTIALPALTGGTFSTPIATYGAWNGSAANAVVVGAPYLTAASSHGMASIFDSMIPGTPGTYWQHAPYTSTAGLTLPANYGYAVAVIGDLNGDGRPEVAIGAPSWSPATGGDIGLVEIVDVWNNTLLKVIRPPSGFALIPIIGGPGLQTMGMAFGWSLAALGDLNGDGFGDLAVGAPGCGCVFVYSGATLVPGAGQPVMTGYCQHTGLLNGWSVTSTSDFDADGVADFVAGAISPSNTPLGTVMAFSGKAAIQAGGTQINGMYLTGVLHLNSYAGYSVARIRDSNADGVGDFLVGGPAINLTTSHAWLYSGVNGAQLAHNSVQFNQWYGVIVCATGNTGPTGKPSVMVADWGPGAAIVWVDNL